MISSVLMTSKSTHSPMQMLTTCPSMRGLDDSDNDAQEGEETPTHTFDDDSENDTADSQQVLSFVGAAQAPSKYKILESCSSLETLRQKRTCGSSLVRRSFMSGTTRTGRDGSREGCIGATSTPEILRVLPQPIVLCDTGSR